MEADCGAEVGADLPALVVPWEGFVDLRLSSADAVPETHERPALAAALTQLNVHESGLLTSKCDVWMLERDEIDPLEFEAAPSQAVCGLASYIDVVRVKPGALASFAAHERWARRVVANLRQLEVRCCRVELVIRGASVLGEEGFGLTAYAMGCGEDEAAGESNWRRALTSLIPVLIAAADDATMT